MSKERKYLKIVCFLYVLDAIACLVFGGIVLAGMDLIDPAEVVSVGGIDFHLQPWALGFGVWGILAGLFYLVFAGAGIRGANTPRKIGPFRVLCAVAVVLSLLGFPLTLVFNGGTLVSANGAMPMLSLVFSILCLWLSGTIAKQAQR